MSDYFTRQNTAEFGPGPTTEIEWLVVEVQDDINAVTRCAIVRGKTAYEAFYKAESVIEDLNKQKSVLLSQSKR